jgi:hypothetical protein
MNSEYASNTYVCRTVNDWIRRLCMFGFFLSWLLGTNWITASLTNFKTYAIFVSAFVLSVTYAFGILMDKLSKFMLEKILN